MGALFLFGPSTVAVVKVGVPGASGRPRRDDYLAASLQSGRSRIDLHIDPAAAARLVATLQAGLQQLQLQGSILTAKSEFQQQRAPE